MDAKALVEKRIAIIRGEFIGRPGRMGAPCTTVIDEKRYNHIKAIMVSEYKVLEAQMKTSLVCGKGSAGVAGQCCKTDEAIIDLILRKRFVHGKEGISGISAVCGDREEMTDNDVGNYMRLAIMHELEITGPRGLPSDKKCQCMPDFKRIEYWKQFIPHGLSGERGLSGEPGRCRCCEEWWIEKWVTEVIPRGPVGDLGAPSPCVKS